MARARVSTQDYRIARTRRIRAICDSGIAVLFRGQVCRSGVRGLGGRAHDSEVLMEERRHPLIWLKTRVPWST